MESSLLEKLILKSCLIDNHFLSLVSSTFSPDYFDDKVIGRMFADVIEHFKNFGNPIPRDILVHDDIERKATLAEADAIDFDIKTNYQFLYEETDKYLREQAVKNAILESVSVVESKKDIFKIYGLLEDALCKSLKITLGLDYFGTMSERIRRMINNDDPRLPTYFNQMDEYLNGGFPPCTLSVFLARIHGHKSSIMANISSRQVLHGHNVVMMTLEMSEDMYSQRYDAIYSGLNINRIYKDQESKVEMVKSLKEIKNPGKLYIKQFPTGKATVNDFRIYLKELQLRKIKIDALYCDYINLMKPSYRNRRDLYQDVKEIAEELRGLSFEFECPVISVSQLNREGMDDIDLEQIDFIHTSESMGLPATVDFLSILGNSDEIRLYKNEVHYKIVKNRLGGRVGEISKLYFDGASLKMYDVSELDQWRSDSIKSLDQRSIVEKVSKTPRSLGKRSRKVEDDD